MLKGELVRCLTVDQPINAFDVSPDKTRLATCSGKSAYVWTYQKLQLVNRINRKPAAVHRARLRLVRFTNDIDSVITACNDHRIVVWNLVHNNSAHPLYILEGHAGTIYDAVFNSDGDLLYTAGADGRVFVWNWAQGERLASAIAESAPVRAIALNVPFKRLSCATVVGSVGVWDIADQTRVCTIEGDSEWVKSQTGAATRAAWIDSVRSHSGPILAAAFSPNGALFLTGAGDSTAKLWSALSFRNDSDSASTQRAAVKVANRQVQLREAVDDNLQNDNVVNGTESPLTIGFYAAVLYTFLHEAPVEHVLFTHDSKYVVTCSRDSTVKIWDVSNGQQVYQVNLPNSATDIRILDANEHSAPYRLFILLNNRVLFLDIGHQQRTPAAVEYVHKRLDEKGLGMAKIPCWPSSVYSSNDHHMQIDIDHLATKGITRHDLNRALAHRSVKPNALFAALQAEIVNDQNARPAQLKANMVAQDLRPVDVLRAIALTTNFRFQDVLTALSMTGELAARAYEAVKQGHSLDKILLEMGFTMTSNSILVHLPKPVLQKCFRTEAISSEDASPTHGVIALAFNAPQRIEQQHERPEDSQSDDSHSQNDDSHSIGVQVHGIASPRKHDSPEKQRKEKFNSGQEHIKIGGITSGFHTPRGLIRQGHLQFRNNSQTLSEKEELDYLDTQTTLPPVAGALSSREDMTTGTKLFLRSRIKPPRSADELQPESLDTLQNPNGYEIVAVTGK